MELRDTYARMVSEDYKDRFIAEYCQLKIRYNKLKTMLDKWDNNELDFTPMRNLLETNESIKRYVEGA